MLLIITPNPALDRTMVFAGLRLGAVHRTEHVLVAAGGKGLNVARAARTLGLSVLVTAPLGGLSGEHVAQLAAAEQITGQWYRHTAGETRTCVLLVDHTADDATALNEVGPTLSAADWAGFAVSVLAAAEQAELCVVAGSLPAGVAPEALGALLRDLAAAGKRVIVDTSGPALASALAARPFGVKVNGSELGAALGMPVTTVTEAHTALMQLRSQGIELAVVSLGPQGAVAANPAGYCHAAPPPLQIISSVGSGDSLLAGMCAGLIRGLALPDALALGVACGSADALTIGGGRIDPAMVERIRAGVVVRDEA